MDWLFDQDRLGGGFDVTILLLLPTLGSPYIRSLQEETWSIQGFEIKNDKTWNCGKIPHKIHIFIIRDNFMINRKPRKQLGKKYFVWIAPKKFKRLNGRPNKNNLRVVFHFTIIIIFGEWKKHKMFYVQIAFLLCKYVCCYSTW